MPTSRPLSFAGALPEESEEPEAERKQEAEALIAAVVEVKAARGDMDEVMRLFRHATVWVETEQIEDAHSVRCVQVQGLRWIPVFSSLEQLALFCQETGRGDREVAYGRLTGADVIDVCLPALPPGTGMVLDPLADHVLALPAVTGIVSDDLALDTAHHGGAR